MLSYEHFDVSLNETTVITDGNDLTNAESTWSETTLFGKEFIANRFDNLSISPEGNDSSALIVGMVHSRSPSLHTIFEESVGEDDLALSEGGSSGFPISRGCNAVNPTIPIATTPPPEGTLVHLTIPMVSLRTAVLHPDIGLLPEWLRAY
jgi:hypothetical protein